MKRESVGGQRLAQCTWHAVVTPRRRHCISLANGAAGPGVLRAPAVCACRRSCTAERFSNTVPAWSMGWDARVCVRDIPCGRALGCPAFSKPPIRGKPKCEAQTELLALRDTSLKRGVFVSVCVCERERVGKKEIFF